jgi:hypothetical protein
VKIQASHENVERHGTTSENSPDDFDGRGQITPTDAISAINRLGYSINTEVMA